VTGNGDGDKKVEVFDFMPKSALLVVLGICLLFGQALAYGPPPCWETVAPQNVVGFDFEIASVVQGPDKSGLYTYTYTIYRLDNGGSAIYREISHFSFWFPCGPAGEKDMVNGIYGVTVTCTDAGHCPKVEMGETNGMAEPVMDKSCKKFWGFRLDECVDTEEKMFLFPNLNGISFPFDPDDPYCTITFKCRSAFEWGKWLVKGGDGKSGLYDSGDIKVPSCFSPVDAGNMSWGAIKVMYR
jgi:hypothetical protein